MAKTTRIGFEDNHKRFDIEDACRECLIQHRWPDGVYLLNMRMQRANWGASTSKFIFMSTAIVLTAGSWTAIYSTDCFLQRRALQR